MNYSLHQILETLFWGTKLTTGKSLNLKTSLKSNSSDTLNNNHNLNRAEDGAQTRDPQLGRLML